MMAYRIYDKLSDVCHDVKELKDFRKYTDAKIKKQSREIQQLHNQLQWMDRNLEIDAHADRTDPDFEQTVSAAFLSPVPPTNREKASTGAGQKRCVYDRDGSTAEKDDAGVIETGGRFVPRCDFGTT